MVDQYNARALFFSKSNMVLIPLVPKDSDHENHEGGIDVAPNLEAARKALAGLAKETHQKIAGNNTPITTAEGVIGANDDVDA